MYKVKNYNVTPSNHRLAHNPTGMLFAVVQEKLGGKLCFRKRKVN